jgi:hypothetical protein
MQQVVRDVDLSPEVAINNNLILLGGPTQNLWSAKLESGFPCMLLWCCSQFVICVTQYVTDPLNTSVHSLL